MWSVVTSNINAAARYLKLYNKASAPTVGTDTPVLTIPLPPAPPTTTPAQSPPANTRSPLPTPEDAMIAILSLIAFALAAAADARSTDLLVQREGVIPTTATVRSK